MSEVKREVEDGVDATVVPSAAGRYNLIDKLIDQTFGAVDQSKATQNGAEASADVGSPAARNVGSDEDRPRLVPGAPAGDDSFFYAQV